MRNNFTAKIDEQVTEYLKSLKAGNPTEYLRKYTRLQVSQLPQIKNNQMGFVCDSMCSDGSYRSTWLSQDKKSCIIGCVEEVNNPDSKIQLLKIGT